MTPPVGSYWLLRHPDVTGVVCLVSDDEFRASSFTPFLDLPRGTAHKKVTLVSLDEFLKAARKDK